MNELISVIIPVYNVEDYLRDCVKSVLNQSYKNIEIILINDGSTDKSGMICDRFHLEDKRIKVIHKENGGLSDARNVGIKNASGSYITFIDSDDIVNVDFIKSLYECLKTNKSDISVCDLSRFIEIDEIECLADVHKRYEKTFSNVECIKSVYNSEAKGLSFIACAKLYKKTLFTKNNIYFPVGKIHEDIFTTYKLLFYAEKISYINDALYYYRERPNSIMQSKISKKNLDILAAVSSNCDFYYSKKNLYLLSLAYNDFMNKCFNLYVKMVEFYDEKDKKEVLNFIIKENKYIKTKYLDKINYSKIKTLYYDFIFILPDKFKCIIYKIRN